MMKERLRTLKVVIEGMVWAEPLYKRVIKAIQKGTNVRLNSYEKDNLRYLIDCRYENHTITKDDYYICLEFTRGK